jgi:hypothetical protein
VCIIKGKDDDEDHNNGAGILDVWLFSKFSIPAERSNTTNVKQEPTRTTLRPCSSRNSLST